MFKVTQIVYQSTPFAFIVSCVADFILLQPLLVPYVVFRYKSSFIWHTYICFFLFKYTSLLKVPHCATFCETSNYRTQGSVAFKAYTLKRRQVDTWSPKRERPTNSYVVDISDKSGIWQPNCICPQKFKQTFKTKIPGAFPWENRELISVEKTGDLSPKPGN